MVLWLAACITTVRFPPGTTWWDTADSGFDADSGTTTTRPEAPTRFLVAGGGCDAADTAYSFSFRTDGWTLDGALDLYRSTDQAAEFHPLRLVASDPDGAWDELAVGPLPDGTDPAAQLAGVSTRFDCAEEAALTMVARIHDPSGKLTDCIVWGADPAGAVAWVRGVDPEITTLGGCRTWTP